MGCLLGCEDGTKVGCPEKKHRKRGMESDIKTTYPCTFETCLPEGSAEGRLLGCPVGDRADMLLIIQHKKHTISDSSFIIENKACSTWVIS